MIDLSFGLFGKRLHHLLSSITPTTRDYEVIYEHVQSLSNTITSLAQQGKFLPLSAPYVSVVGSVFKETALKPIQHVDVFLHLDQSYLSVNGKSLTVSESQPHPLLSTTLNPSKIITVHPLLSQISALLSPAFETALSRTQQTIIVKNPAYLTEFRLTPTVQLPDFFLIPEEKTEITWKKVHHLREKQALQALDQKHKGEIMNLIRVIKYWNEQKNNEAFRNVHLEAIVHPTFAGITQPVGSTYEALKIYVDSLSKFLYNTPDPTGLSSPVNAYLPDTIDRWYLFMNRVDALKKEVHKGEQSFVEFLLSTETELPETHTPS